MAKIEKFKGLILKKQAYLNDIVLDILTPYGVLKIIAKNAAKPGSRRGAELSPGQIIRGTYYSKYHNYLSEFEILENLTSLFQAHKPLQLFTLTLQILSRYLPLSTTVNYNTIVRILKNVLPSNDLNKSFAGVLIILYQLEIIDSPHPRCSICGASVTHEGFLVNNHLVCKKHTSEDKGLKFSLVTHPARIKFLKDLISF